MFDEIEKLRKQREVLQSNKDSAMKSFRVKEAELNELQDADERTHHIRTRIDQEALYPFGIERPAEHGGKLAGRGCKNLMGNAWSVFEIIKSILLEEATSNSMSEHGKKEIELLCDYTRDCLVLLDGFFSLMRTSTKEIDTPEKKQQVIRTGEEYLSHVALLWDALSLSWTPKFHVAMAHALSKLPVDIDAEEWVERLHQIRIRNLVRLRGQRDRTRRFAYESRWEQQNRTAKSKEIQASVRAKTALPKETLERRRASRRRRDQIDESQSSTRQRKNDSLDREELRARILDSWRDNTPQKLLSADDCNTKDATAQAEGEAP